MSQSASEPLSEGSKFQNFLGGMPPDSLTNCVFVSCQRSARRKSSMTVTCIHTGHYDLNFVSECLRITLRRLKIPKFSGGMNPLTNCVFVSCQGSARRKSSMTVTCIHTGHYDLNFVSECLRITLRGLKILKFSGGGGGGGACPQTPLQIAAYGRSPRPPSFSRPSPPNSKS